MDRREDGVMKNALVEQVRPGSYLGNLNRENETGWVLTVRDDGVMWVQGIAVRSLSPDDPDDMREDMVIGYNAWIEDGKLYTRSKVYDRAQFNSLAEIESSVKDMPLLPSWIKRA